MTGLFNEVNMKAAVCCPSLSVVPTLFHTAVIKRHTHTKGCIISSRNILHVFLDWASLWTQSAALLFVTQCEIMSLSIWGLPLLGLCRICDLNMYREPHVIRSRVCDCVQLHDWRHACVTVMDVLKKRDTVPPLSPQVTPALQHVDII